MTDKKKKTAIIAAVAHYIQTGEAAMVCAQTACFPQVEPAVKSPAPPASNPWGMSGRHQQMQMRSMMQMKAFQRSQAKV